MTDVQTQERVAGDGGRSHEGVATTQVTADSATAASARRSPGRAWSGRSSALKAIGLLAFVALAFLALDFVFHATGSLNVGFAALTFSVGSFLASPFTGIFRSTYASQGNLLVWADVLAMAVYTAAAIVVATLVAKALHRPAHRAA
ncbi:MAG: hypothetical protein ABSA40_03785 [Candidatus Dormibacteria bacterium]|jgi:hypothetical protein